jgi:hypothetical protein
MAARLEGFPTLAALCSFRHHDMRIPRSRHQVS